MLKAYRFRIYPTKKQQVKLQETLELLRELYNAALQERKDAYRICGISLSFYHQCLQLPEIKNIREEYRDIHSQVLQDILRRVDKAFQAFFQRFKEGKTPGFPRYKAYDRFDSFTYPQSGFSLTHDKKICLSKIGSIRIKLHREIAGRIKICTIKREGEKWFAIFVSEIEQTIQYHPSQEAIGIDLGLNHFATFSNGETIENPRYLRKAEEKLKKFQQQLARKKKGSKRRKKTARIVGKNHRKVRNKRQDFLHKESRKLANRFQTIVFEDLQIKNMVRKPKVKQREDGSYVSNGASAKSGLNKSIIDAGWNLFVQYCAYKEEESGGTVVQVNPKNTSQICSNCGSLVPKTLEERWHSCNCGCELDRDHNAAKNILQASLKKKGLG